MELQVAGGLEVIADSDGVLEKIDGYLQAGDFDDAAEAACKARDYYRSHGNMHGQASANLALAKARLGVGDAIESLRAAEKSINLWQRLGDSSSQVEALMIVSEAKIDIIEERQGKQLTYASVSTALKSSEFALSAVKALKPNDFACFGNVLYSHARVAILAKAFHTAWLSAKAAARQFRKAGDALRRARSLLVFSKADLALGYHDQARQNADIAQGEFERLGDLDGKAKASDIQDDINKALGLPTKAELLIMQQRQLEQRQQLMMQQQMMASGSAMKSITAFPIQEQYEEEAAASKGPLVLKRDGSALDLSKALDPGVLKAKITEIAIAIIGDDEEFDDDTPLMEAGLTSNTAVIFRDELSKDLPGVKLPPTMLFDYPTVGAMAEFILESSQ